MTLVEHLQELRRRLVLSVIAVLVGTIVAWAFYSHILDFLTQPLEEGERIGNVRVGRLNVGGITTAFTVRLRVSFFGGIVAALPVMLWQVWRFVTPGLYPRERRYGMAFVVSALGLFAVGTYVAFALLPQAIGFLIGFAAPPLRPLIFVDQYLRFVIFMVLAFGVSFQFPLLLAMLAAVGVVTSRRMASWRRYAFFVAFVIGAVATPSVDPVSMILMAVPLYLLYEITYLVIRFVMRK